MSAEEILLNTYKAKANVTVQAETEEQAKSKIANLLNGDATTDPNALVTSVNEIDVEVKHENERKKEKNERKEKLDKLARDQIKEQRKQGRMKHKWQIPDEVVVVDPDTGSGVVVKTPDKDELLKDTEEVKAEEQQVKSQQQDFKKK